MVFKTEHNNYYFYDKNNRIHYCHPILALIISNPKISENEVKGKGINIDKKTFDYYKSKYNQYKKMGYFKNLQNHFTIDRILTKSDIQNVLANMRQVTFEILDFCNLNCDYCIYSSLYNKHDIRNKSKMSFKKAKNILDYLIPFWNSNLNNSANKNIYISFYGGEPLLNIEFIKQVVEYTKNINLLKNYFTYTLTTNGTLLSKYIDFFVANDFNILISLDGNKYNPILRVREIERHIKFRRILPYSHKPFPSF